MLVSTTLSKAALRVAADLLSWQENVAYFPAYEIITGSFARGRYFAGDLRQVTEEGVDHVMGLFFQHVMGEAPSRRESEPPDAFLEESARIIGALCDEDALDHGC